MTHAKTPTEAAADWLCPLARTFADPKAVPHCRGPECAAWRWQPLSSDLITPHVKKAMDGNAFKHKEAVAWVMERRAELGIPTEPTHGYCGAGGEP